MKHHCENVAFTGPFGECIECEYLCNGCSGPRTSAMDLDTWLLWIKKCMKRFGISHRALAEGTPLSKSTVDDILAGRRKDISRETGLIIENFVLGADKWSCAKRLADGKDIVYEDRPETLEALRVAREQLREKEDTLARHRVAYESEVQEYKDLVIHMRTQIDRKDDYIDRLAKKAGI